jgi:hypothetical protein
MSAKLAVNTKFQLADGFTNLTRHKKLKFSSKKTSNQQGGYGPQTFRKEYRMTRYEVKTPHKSFAGCEGTIEEAKAYIAAIKKAGVEVLEVNYFDNEERVANIRAGKF